MSEVPLCHDCTDELMARGEGLFLEGAAVEQWLSRVVG